MIANFRAVILGAPGSGKGTISSRIISKFDMKHVASGDILRRHIMDETEIGVKAKEYVDNGLLVPESIMISLIMNEIGCTSSSFLLDGFPRTRQQAVVLSEKIEIDSALNLVVPFEVITERIKGRWIHVKSGRVYNTEFNPPKVPTKDDITGEDLIQRPDDNPVAVLKRLNLYKESIGPVIDFYEKNGKLINFCGSTSNEIWPKVYKYISEHICPVAESGVNSRIG